MGRRSGAGQQEEEGRGGRVSEEKAVSGGQEAGVGSQGKGDREQEAGPGTRGGGWGRRRTEIRMQKGKEEVEGGGRWQGGEQKSRSRRLGSRRWRGKGALYHL